MHTRSRMLAFMPLVQAVKTIEDLAGQWVGARGWRWATSAAALHATLSLMGQAAIAVENLGARRVLSVGCHQFNGTCFVSLDGPPIGASLGCGGFSSNECRWDNADTAHGRRTYAPALAAFLAGRRVSVTVDGCSAQG